jgi:hypothetical protein
MADQQGDKSPEQGGQGPGMSRNTEDNPQGPGQGGGGQSAQSSSGGTPAQASGGKALQSGKDKGRGQDAGEGASSGSGQPTQNESGNRGGNGGSTGAEPPQSGGGRNSQVGSGEEAGEGQGNQESQSQTGTTKSEGSPGGNQPRQRGGSGQPNSDQAQASGARGGTQASGGQPTGMPAAGKHSGVAGQTPVGGGATQGGGSIGENAKDDTQPSPMAQEPENPSTDDIAPQAGQSQSDLVLRTVKDLLAKDAVTPDLEKETGMTREQMEHFVKKYEGVKSAPAGPGREIQFKPGQHDAADRPSANLPGIDRNSRYSTRNLKERGTMPHDDVHNMLEGIRFAPPPELRSKFENYKSKLARSRTGSSSRPTAAKADDSGTR